MTTRPPKICPECERDLNDVAIPGNCPECGLPLDDQTQVWRSRQGWQHHVLTNGLLGLGLGGFVALAELVSLGEVPNPFYPITIALAASLAGILVRRILSGRLSGRFVATTPRGVLIGTRPRTRLVPWDDIRGVATRGRVPQIRRRESSINIPLEDVFESPEEVNDFRVTVDQQRRRRRRENTTG